MKRDSDREAQGLAQKSFALTFVYGVAACLAAGFYLLTPQQVGKPVTLFGAAPDGLAPDVMPRFVLVAIGCVALFGLVKALKGGAEEIGVPGTPVIVTCLASFLYAALLVPIGFVLASTLIVALLAFYLGGRRPVGLVLSSLVVPVALYLVFTRVLHISLPSGPVGF